MRQLSLQEIAIYIDENQQLFTPGNVFNEDHIVNFAQIADPVYSRDRAQLRRNVNNHQLQKLTVQNKFNKVLAKRGLYMAQKENIYYQMASLPENGNTPGTITRRIAKYTNEATAKAICGTRLAAGYAVHKGRWSRISPEEL